jgi:hypothetical protein
MTNFFNKIMLYTIIVTIICYVFSKVNLFIIICHILKWSKFIYY